MGEGYYITLFSLIDVTVFHIIFLIMKTNIRLFNCRRNVMSCLLNNTTDLAYSFPSYIYSLFIFLDSFLLISEYIYPSI